ANPVLRSSFSWEGLWEPVQLVHDRVPVPFECRPAIDQAGLDTFLQADRARGFDLSEPPLFRVTFFGDRAAAGRLVWTVHHILMDGRSFVLILHQVHA